VRAKAVIKHITYATLSTVSADGEPWNTPVYFAYDEHYNLYWGSHTGSQHSRNIQANGKVFIVIYNSTVAPGQGEGVYITATAHELTDAGDITFAHNLIQERRNPIPYWKMEQVQGKVPIRLYKATPQAVWMNDEGSVNGNYIDTRTEVTL
jgi:nitroimidazol reductase NimA-like FMN-containing flavoprotein (pyridoxamine 5'-phosphate oxidase superfamily)